MTATIVAYPTLDKLGWAQMPEKLPEPHRGREGSAANLHVVESAAVSSNKLLTVIASQIVTVFRDRSLPRELKLLLVPLLFMVPVYSLMIVVMVSDVTYCILRSQIFNGFNYLIFVAVTFPITAATVVSYSLVSEKYVNTRELEEQLETITKRRRSRAKKSGIAQ